MNCDYVRDINKQEKEITQFFTSYFLHNKDIVEKGYLFTSYGDSENHDIAEQRKYIDISYVNYWIDEQGNPIYKVHMKNGESFDVDNQKFNRAHCLHGVNLINEVCKREYL